MFCKKLKKMFLRVPNIFFVLKFTTEKFPSKGVFKGEQL